MKVRHLKKLIADRLSEINHELFNLDKTIEETEQRSVRYRKDREELKDEQAELRKQLDTQYEKEKENDK